MEIKDIAEYEETDSVLAQYTISSLHHRIDKAINRISLIRMDRNTSIETHKALDEILNVLKGVIKSEND